MSESRAPVLPSGEQFEIAFGHQRAVVVELGGGLRTYTRDGLDVLDGYGAAERCASGRGQLLVPWPNRIEDGRYDFGGRTHQLPLTEPESHNAIHGLVRWVPWRLVEHEPHRVVLAFRVLPQPGYPFALELTVEYALSDDGLFVCTTARNIGSETCPFGCGQHPYLTLGSPTVDELELTSPARRVLVSDDRGLPIGSTPVDGTEYDFRVARRIGTTTLDNAFTDLERGTDRTARITLRNPESGARLALWVDERYEYVMLFTGDPLPDIARRSLAVEPMTCPPNAFRSGESVVQLEPGQSTTAAWGIAS